MNCDMQKVSVILDKKQDKVYKISPWASLGDAMGLMNSRNVECLVVKDDNDLFFGLVTEHDIARRTWMSERLLSNTTVQQIVNTHFPFVDVNDTVEHCMQLMKRFSIRYLPVFDVRSFKGIISTDDILEEAIYSRAGIFDEE